MDAILQFQVGGTGERRLHWFGQLDANQTLTVTLRLYSMYDALTTVNRYYQCYHDDESNCTLGWSAWVVRGSFNGTINLCDRFWNDNDNQARLEILAHEHAHVVGAEDHPWIEPTCANAASIAEGDPSFAVDHAQNYACFIMNREGIPD
jgi:hypothetical protein